MAWDNRKRKSELPGNWQSLRRMVIARDGGRCVAALTDGTRCVEAGNQVDHIVRGADHSLSNLQLLCVWHHTRKSSAEGAAARRAAQAQRPTRKRPDRPMPGDLS